MNERIANQEGCDFSPNIGMKVNVLFFVCLIIVASPLTRKAGRAFDGK